MHRPGLMGLASQLDRATQIACKRIGGVRVKEPNYQGFWDALPHISIMGGKRPDLADAFRHQHREEIIGLLSMLHRIGLVWGATSLHPAPPEQCDHCGATLNEFGLFVDGSTTNGMWANMCGGCFLKLGHSVGCGKGQLYLNLGDGNWRLVAGGDPNAREGDPIEGEQQ